MAASQKETRRWLRAENIAIGDRSSRLSSAIFILLSVVAIFATVIFGAVDTMTWVILSAMWAVLVLLWLADAWKGDGILLNTSVLQLPLLALLAIGLVQLIPLGGGTLSNDPFATRIFLVHLTVYITFFAACLTFINNEGRVRKV